MDWLLTKCSACGEEFQQRLVSERGSGVLRENCSRCREKMGHRTAVKWGTAELASKEKP